MGWNQQAYEERRRLQLLTAEAEMAYLSGNEPAYVGKLRAIAQALKAGDSSLRLHIHSRLRNIRSTARVGQSRGGHTPPRALWSGPPVSSFGKRNKDSSKAVGSVGPPLWSTRNRVRYPATDGVTPYWWSCPKGERDHPDWQQTLWQYEGGKTCPRCLGETAGANSWMPHEVRWGALIRCGDSLDLTLEPAAPGVSATDEFPAGDHDAPRSRIGTFINTQKYQVFGDYEVVDALRSDPGLPATQAGGSLNKAVSGAHPGQSRSRFVQERTYRGLDARSGHHVARQETIGPDAVWWRVLLECQHVFEQARNACFHSASGAFGQSALCLVCNQEQRITAAVPLFGVLGD